MRRVRLGIVPLDAAYPVMPVHGFWMFDEKLVRAETFTSTPPTPPSCGAHAKVVADQVRAAVNGADDRELITTVMTVGDPPSERAVTTLIARHHRSVPPHESVAPRD